MAVLDLTCQVYLIGTLDRIKYFHNTTNTSTSIFFFFSFFFICSTSFHHTKPVPPQAGVPCASAYSDSTPLDAYTSSSTSNRPLPTISSTRTPHPSPLDPRHLPSSSASLLQPPDVWPRGYQNARLAVELARRAGPHRTSKSRTHELMMVAVARRGSAEVQRLWRGRERGVLGQGREMGAPRRSWR